MVSVQKTDWELIGISNSPFKTLSCLTEIAVDSEQCLLAQQDSTNSAKSLNVTDLL